MLAGKGFFIWQILACEGGNFAAIAEQAACAGLSHALVKIADCATPFNVTTSGQDLVPPLVAALRSKGLAVWGWHYIYGQNPAAEAKTAAERVIRLGLDGYVIDAECEFKKPGMANKAKIFMAALGSILPSGIPVGLSSYRYPSLHANFPWTAFLDGVDLVLPQVYWLFAHNPAEQLRRSVKELRALTDKPICPTGAAWKQGAWAASAEEVTQFLEEARRLDLPAAGFWDWQHARKLPATWDAIAAFPWTASGGGPVTPPALPWTAIVMPSSLAVRKGPGTDWDELGVLYQAARPLVQELKVSGSDLWARVGDNLWAAMTYHGAKFMEWTR